MSNKNSISIILVNYNTATLTCNCIKSIYDKVNDIDYEIIVVDNASQDDSCELIAQTFPDVRLIKSNSNLGFGRANNLGAKSATGDYLFFLNTDTLLLNNPLPYFLQTLRNNPQVGVVGAFLKNKVGEYCRSGGKTYTINKYLKIALRAFLHKESTKEIDFTGEQAQVGYVLGADMFMSKSLFNELKGFDENIFMYFEDVELCDRIMQKGKQCLLIKGPEIIHLEGASTTSQFSRLHNTASMIYCFTKKYNPLQVRIFQICYFILKLPLLIVGKNKSEELDYLMSIFRYNRYLSQL